MNLRILLYLFLIGNLTQAQNYQYEVSEIPEELKTNANAVILEDNMDIEIVSEDQMRVRIKKVITVLNKEGNSVVQRYAHYDEVSKLKNLLAEIYNKAGVQIERIRQKDFIDIAAVDGFSIYTDSRVKFFNYTPINYPYTVAFSYTYETSNTAFIPYWNPLNNYEASIKKSTYKVSYPPGFELRKMEKNFDNSHIDKLSRGNSMHYEMTNVPAQKWEMLSPDYFKIDPRLILAIDKFNLEGVDGFAQDWQSLGKWQYENLLRNQDLLSPEIIRTVEQLLADVEDPKEKVRKIYEYVQKNTRYVSVQLGIGGWKPISAVEVDKVKYGDCKGLTNYTKALLKSQGIESNYCVVWAGNEKRDMEHDFASFQGNHVILNVPLEDEEIWLECTSQDIPFGFLGDFTDDRDVFVVTKDGGFLKHTVAYLNEDNRRHTNSELRITDSGTLEAKVWLESTGIIYDNRSDLVGKSELKKDEFYKEFWSNINGLKIKSINLDNNKNDVVLSETLELEAASYASKIGNDLLFKINPFDQASFVPIRYRSRKKPFEIQRGYLTETDLKVDIPSTYDLTEIPAPVEISNKFGTYKMTIEFDETGVLIYKRKLFIRKGTYPKEDYKIYRDFRRKVAKYDNIKILLNNRT